MKTPDKYRFSLQWGAETEEKIQAGEFLERLGNRKSEFVVVAVTEYLVAHPEVLSLKQKLKIVINPSITRDQVEAIVRSLIDEKIASTPLRKRESGEMGEYPEDELDVDEMLKNLDFFK